MARFRFTLEQLRTFVEVADTGNMTRAASHLYLTQGAVTQQVRNLERGLGLQLLERTGGGILLTSAGLRIAAECRTALRAVEAVREAARNLGNLESASLRIGASPTAAAHYLPALLERFTSRHPGVAIAVATDNTPHLGALVASGELDCAVIEGPTDHHELVRLAIAADQLTVVVGSGHPLARLESPDPQALAAHYYLGREPGASLELYAERILGTALREARRMEFGHLDAVRAAVLAGLGYAVLPTVAIAAEVARGLVVVLPWPPLLREIAAVRRGSAEGAPLEAFWAVVQEAASAG